MSEISRKAATVCESWHLGRTSSRYESSGAGAGVISTGRGDRGGVSYGTYQLSSREGTVQEYLASSRYGAQFNGLTPATPAFDAKWREIARTDPGFGHDQHEFIGRTHYREQFERLQRQGIDLHDRGRAVHDALWSTSVQFRGLTPRIVAGGLKEKFGEARSLSQLTDRQIVEAIQDYKIEHNNTLFRSSPALWPGLLKRAHSEKQALLELVICEEALERQSHSIQGRAADGAENSALARAERLPVPLRTAAASVASSTMLKLGSSGHDVERLQRTLSWLGYRADHGSILRSDGVFGTETRQAVQAFQRDYNLQADGIVGFRTLSALARAEAEILPGPTHPHHALYTQTLAAVHLMEANRCIASGAHSERLAAVLAVEAVRGGLARVDRVELNESGALARAVQANPTRDELMLNRMTDGVDTQQAMRQSVRESSELMQQAVSEQPVRQDELQRQQVRAAVM
jgi:hypothetical protein